MTSVRLLLLTGLVLGLVGCASRTTTVKTPSHPNQLNAFDGQTYNTLITAQAAINQAKLEIDLYPNMKPVLNQAITAYNNAMDTYKNYHEFGDSSLVSTLQAEIGILMPLIVQITTALHTPSTVGK